MNQRICYSGRLLDLIDLLLLDLIDLLFTLIVGKEANLWGDWTDGFSFEEGREFAPLVFMLSSK